VVSGHISLPVLGSVTAPPGMSVSTTVFTYLSHSTKTQFSRAKCGAENGGETHLDFEIHLAPAALHVPGERERRRVVGIALGRRAREERRQDGERVQRAHGVFREEASPKAVG
jgi:hypothetical protein